MGKKVNLIKDLINLQFQIAGIDKKFENALEDKEWYLNNTINEKLYYDEFRPKALAMIKKTLRCSKEMSEKEFSWFTLAWGLKYE